jgi:hypothetical protein
VACVDSLAVVWGSGAGEWEGSTWEEQQAFGEVRAHLV